MADLKQALTNQILQGQNDQFNQQQPSSVGDQGGIYNAQLKSQNPWWSRFLPGANADIGLSPMGLGVVAGSPGGNALVNSLIKEITANRMQPNEAVLKYVAMKYPKLMSKVPGGMFESSLPEGTLGQMTPETEYLPRSIAIDPNQSYGPLHTAETAGHELTHGGIQAERTPSWLYPENYKRPPTEEDWIASKTDAKQKWAEYWNQPAEVNARKGGGTVEDTFLRFLHKYPELKRFFGK